MSIDLKCKAKFPLGETTLVQLLAFDLVESSDGLEILVATNDGTLLCLGNSKTPKDRFIDEERSKEKRGIHLLLKQPVTNNKTNLQSD
jgi:hypothetical protein